MASMLSPKALQVLTTGQGGTKMDGAQRAIGLRTRGREAVQPLLAPVPVACNQVRQHTDGFSDAGLQGVAVCLSWATQNIIGHQIAAAGVTYPYAQPTERPVVSQTTDDIPEPVVATMPSSLFEAQGADRYIQLVVGHQNAGSGDAIEVGKGGNRKTAFVHEPGR